MDIPKRGASESPDEHQSKARKKDESSSESEMSEESPSGLTTSEEGSQAGEALSGEEFSGEESSGEESPSYLTTSSEDESNVPTHPTHPVSSSAVRERALSVDPRPSTSAAGVGAQSSQSTSARPAPQEPKRVKTSRDEYIITREGLGKGTFGFVVKAQRQSDQRDVALKVMGNQSYRESADQEESVVVFLMANPHRNIVQFFDTWKGPTVVLLISELSTIGDIYKAMQIRNDLGQQIWVQFDENLTRHLIIGIARGLQHLHRLRVSHGDLKLHNILLFPNLGAYHQLANDPRGMITRYDRWIPKLTDFSSSQRNIIAPEEAIIRVLPTCAFQYAAPESYRMAQYDSIIADIFSLGCCLISMILGAVPFDARVDPDPRAHVNPAHNTIALNEQQKMNFMNELKCSTTYKRNICKICSELLRHLLEGLLETNPQNRITLDQFFAHQWVMQPKSREFEDVSGKVSFLTSHPFIEGIQIVIYDRY